MKQKIAALMAALLMLSACSAEKPSVSENNVPAEPVAQTETVPGSDEQTSTAENSDAEKAPEAEMETKPIEPEIHFSENFTDEPYAFQADIEEIVSISLTLPKFTLDSADAADKINAVFETLQLKLKDYAGTTVYETAQARNTIGFVDGSYVAGLEDGVLTVTYMVTEHYADSDAVTTYDNVYRFDASTGERLDT